MSSRLLVIEYICHVLIAADGVLSEIINLISSRAKGLQEKKNLIPRKEIIQVQYIKHIYTRFTIMKY